MPPRIVSLLPAATEIVAALGMLDHLVGVSHECNYPDTVISKPRVTGCEIHSDRIASSEVDRWVSEKLLKGEDLYTIDAARMGSLRPDLILTQRLCDVCAPSYGSVQALAQTLPGPPRVLNLEPNTLEDIFQNIRQVAEALGLPNKGETVVAGLRERVERIRQRVADVKDRPRVAVIEWLDPVFCSGHWTPELVDIAGGQEVLGMPGRDSGRRTWADVHVANPKVIVIACCGQTVSRAMQDWNRLKQSSEIQALAAVQAGNVFAADGNAYFSRPGPRVVDTLEILAEIIHPERFADAIPNRGVIRIQG